MKALLQSKKEKKKKKEKERKKKNKNIQTEYKEINAGKSSVINPPCLPVFSDFALCSVNGAFKQM